MALFATLLVVACSELEILQATLMEVKQREGEPQSAINSSLAQCVKHHQQILRSVNICGKNRARNRIEMSSVPLRLNVGGQGEEIGCSLKIVLQK
jgi:hypothetical protein